MGEGEAAGAVDDRAEAVGVEGGGDVSGGTALGTVAGDEEENAGHGLAELGDLLGIGGTDDGAEETVAGAVAVGFRPVCEVFGDVSVEGFAVGDEVLEVACGGVAGADEGEEAVAGSAGGLDEGIDAVGAEVGVDGEGVGGPGSVGSVEVVFVGGEIGFGVAFGGAADVVSLAVEDDEEASGAGVDEGVAEGGHSLGPLVFVKSGLKFDGGNAAGEDVDELEAEGAEGVGAAGAGIGKGVAQRLGEHGEAGVDARDDGVSDLATRGDQPACERHDVDPRRWTFVDRAWRNPRILESVGLADWWTGRSAAWLARLLGVQEVRSSNLLGPTG